MTPRLTYSLPADRHAGLSATLAKLREGRPLKIVALGDSIINDAARSGWILRLKETYPRSSVQMTTIVRGGTGCWYYREADRIRDLLAPERPDLVILGGLSERGDVEAIAEVVRQIRSRTDAEILLTTAVFGNMDPYDAATLIVDPCSGYGTYGERLRDLATRERVSFFDLTRAWVEAVRHTGEPLRAFKRDPVHANSRGEQLLGRALAAFFAGD
jgi:hypothetical protein